ncbi:MAG TPA: NrfD/PsrC family molybdoenzyme membrane anchor subunit [Acidimicrobiia bacterium]|nr:NrfD/PsrC family molybdoenzyme membrane anchor subunit [Acidimicrobiia bacterium]
MDPLTEGSNTGRGSWDDRLDEAVLSPARRSGIGFRLWVGLLIVLIAVGVIAVINQSRNGLYVTGMRDRISWGLYIAAFVFFAGISMAGTLISAILRASHATWRTPITRIAESITVMALVVSALFVLVDMGKPVRLFQMWPNGNWQSPLMWDMMAITVYLTCSVVYLLVPMIPDLAFFQDRLRGRVPRLHSRVYETLSFGWEGNPVQRRALAKSVAILMVLIIPVAVSVHTVLSLVFSTTTRVSWNSTAFGFFFVFGAIFSGLAVLIIIFAVVRKRFHLEEYITERHFTYLGYLLATAGMVMIYANATEFITKGYHASADDLFAFRELFVTDLAPLFWFYFFGGLVLPVLIVAFKRTRTITGLVIGSSFAIVAMFVERYFIVVGGMRVPLMPYEPSSYAPTWVEWALIVGGMALFVLLLTLFTRFFPILAVWEMKEEHAERSGVTS